MMKLLILTGLLASHVEMALAVNFDTEIIPVFTTAGCNAGACHGAAAGRGGFHLSLLGANASNDYEAVVHELEGRRINQTHPEHSLLLAKPTGILDHGGDVALDDDSPGAKRLVEWIRSGAPRGEQRKLTHFEITPERYLGTEVPVDVRLQVTARFDDGEPEDVTGWTVFTAADPIAVDIDSQRMARITRRGQQVVIARFLNRVVPIQLNIPFSENPIDLSGEPRANFIDDEVLKILSELRIPISPPATDSDWLRRVTLDLTGRLPDPASIETFMADQDRDRRPRYVESIMSNEAFNDYWTLRFSKLLRMHSQPNDKDGFNAYSEWLREEIRKGAGLDQLAIQLLTAEGDSHIVGPANFGRMINDAREHAELAGHFFMGMRLGCANCHNHPLDRWTQDDYHGFAAVFARLERGRIVSLTSRGAVTNLRTNEPAVPRIPGERDLSGNADFRHDVAHWLTSNENRYFARATVNRLWYAMFGRGLVEPTDDLRETNPPTHPELLERLADDFVDHGYDFRHTLKQMALSNAYGRSGQLIDENRSDDRFYSHAYRRLLPPEVLVDAIADVTGIADRFDGQVTGIRAVAIVDPLAPAPSLDILGRCTKAKECDENSNTAGGLSSQLHLLNGELINRKLTDKEGRLHQMIHDSKSDEQIIRQFYLLAFSRMPITEELHHWSNRLSDSDASERRSKLEDFVWSLLNSRAFLENH
ncbi:MAG: DUF1553 domain-containing protein [Pirellulaceae bacterium]|nr:DUF1553 domain-containing protein [Pirellulaceae bacterium]